MEDGIVFDAQQGATVQMEFSHPHRAAQEEEGGVTYAGTNSAWIRRHLSDSIYLWACGEKADDEDDDPKLTDKLIGWLILFMQGFAYTMLILLARTTSNSNTGSSADDGRESTYLLPSVTGAMYLLVSSTTHDLRSGFSLLVDGSCAGHRAFGIGLLVVYGIMITAAMTVLVSTSDDSAAVVLNAVTVLFIADLDEKALKFLLTVPQELRLFWAIESIGISFALAHIAIIYVGDSSPLLEGNNDIVASFPTWFVWAASPAALTVCSYILSTTLQCIFEACSSEALQGVRESSTPDFVVSRCFSGCLAAMKRAKERVAGEPCLYSAIGVWLAQAVASWLFYVRKHGDPIAWNLRAIVSASEEHSFPAIDNQIPLLYLNAVLAAGIAAKAWVVCLRRRECAGANIPELRQSSEIRGPNKRWGGWVDSRVPSLLVGWGIGYWVTSLLYVLGSSWVGGGWQNAPILVTLVGYIFLPCFLFASVFMVADTNVLGTRFRAFIKPAVDILRDRGRVEYWIMATVLRDIVFLWIYYCYMLRVLLNYL